MGERIGTSVQDAVAGLLSDYRLRDQGPTAGTYGYRLRPLVAAHGDRRLCDLTPADMRAFVASQSHLAPGTLLNTFGALGALFAWAKDQGIVTVSPMAGIPKPRQRRPPHRYLSADQLRACYGACTDDLDRAILLLCGATGLRVSELLGLRWQDIDFAQRRFRVLGKGRKWRGLALDALTAEVVSRLPRSTLTVMPFRAPSTVMYRVKGIASRAGLGDLTTHQLRHSFAVAYYRTTGDAFALQALLGHSSPVMTGYYVRDVREDEAVRRQAETDLAARLFGE